MLGGAGLALLSIIPVASSAAQVKVTPTETRGRVSTELIGANLLYSFETDAYWRDGKAAEALKDIRIGFLRYPGGAVSQFWHWDKPLIAGCPTCTGGWADSDWWDPRNLPPTYVPTSDWMDLDEYLVQARRAGATPLVGVNTESGVRFGRTKEGVDKAVALVKYANSQGVRHYFIGNEPYHRTESPNDLELSATHYAQLLNTYADAIRGANPNIPIKIVANWVSRLDGRHGKDWEAILKIAGRNIDYIDLHAYWNYDLATFETWKKGGLMTHLGETYTSKIRSFRGLLDRLGSRAKIAMFEWNIGPAPSPAERPSEYQAGLMNAEIFMQSVQGGLDAATFFPLHWSAKNKNYPNMKTRTLFTADEVADSPIYDMLKLYSGVLGNTLVASETFQPGLLSLATYNPVSKAVTVFILNKTDSEKDMTVSLDSFLDEGDKEVRAQAYRAPGGDLGSERAEVVDIPVSFDWTGPSIRVKAGAYSLTKLVVRPSALQALAVEDIGSAAANIRFNGPPGWRTRIRYAAVPSPAEYTPWKEGVSGANLYSHSLTGLEPDTAYSFSIVRLAPSGAKYVHSVRSFATLPKPVIAVRAPAPSTSESGGAAGRFALRRDTGTASELTVWYALSGSAANGADYQRLASSVTFAAGEAWAHVRVVPIDDALFEGTETVILKLSPRAAYDTGDPGEAAVEILDNDEPTSARRRRITLLPAGNLIDVDGFKASVRPSAVSAPTEVDIYDEAEDGAEAEARLEQSRRQGLGAPASKGIRFDPMDVLLGLPASVEVPLIAGVQAAQARAAALYYWDTGAGEWRALPSEMDLQAGVIRAEASALTVLKAFELAASPAGGVVGEVFVFPNPAKRGARATFHIQCDGAERVEIRVYDLAGESVHEASLSGPPSLVDRGEGLRPAYEYVWDTSGAASGVYLYAVAVHGQSKTVRRGKLAVIH